MSTETTALTREQIEAIPDAKRGARALRAAADAAMERNRAEWAEALRIAQEYPVAVEHVRDGLRHVRRLAERDEAEISDAAAVRIVRGALEVALATREPYGDFTVFYHLWKGVGKA